MRAVRFAGHGGREMLVVDKVETPEPGPTEVLVEVAACGVNRVDILSREGQTPAPIALPHTSGSEVSGVVSAAGSDTRFREGDRVLVNPVLSLSLIHI